MAEDYDLPPRGFVDALVEDPAKPPQAQALTGYPGRSASEGHIRLYCDLELRSWVDIPADAVLHRQEVKDEYGLGKSLVWTQPDAKIQTGGAGTGADFFQGAQIPRTQIQGCFPSSFIQQCRPTVQELGCPPSPLCITPRCPPSQDCPPPLTAGDLACALQSALCNLPAGGPMAPGATAWCPVTPACPMGGGFGGEQRIAAAPDPTLRTPACPSIRCNSVFICRSQLPWICTADCTPLCPTGWICTIIQETRVP